MGALLSLWEVVRSGGGIWQKVWGHPRVTRGRWPNIPQMYSRSLGPQSERRASWSPCLGLNPTKHLELPFPLFFLSVSQQVFTVCLLGRLKPLEPSARLCPQDVVLDLVSWKDSMKALDWESGDLGLSLVPFFVWDLSKVPIYSFLCAIHTSKCCFQVSMRQSM